MSPTQYLGMAESDLYLLLLPLEISGVNYMKGLSVSGCRPWALIAIGVCAGMPLELVGRLC